MKMIPKEFILTATTGCGNHPLEAFDNALLNAGVGDYNLIKVSSILPPKCQFREDITLDKGAILPSAYAVIYSSEIGATISAAVAVGIPADHSTNGVIMEYSALGTKADAEETVRSYVKQAMGVREIQISKILSVAAEIQVTSSRIHCAFATLSMW